MSMIFSDLANSPLGQSVSYTNTYNPDLLFAILRKSKRDELQITEPLPFKGVDIWNAFELSWLTTNGKPVVAMAELVVPCDSPMIFESKSLKLYLNSFHQSKFDSQDAVLATLTRDLSDVTQGQVQVRIHALHEQALLTLGCFVGNCLDELDINCESYSVEPGLLTTTSEVVTETVYSDLLKSNCLITNQPDWGSVQISYSGYQIDQRGLLQYLISFRNHNEFHEQCVERIFMDITRQCAPTKLSVYARYTRRGGIDINPFRSSGDEIPENNRLVRQ